MCKSIGIIGCGNMGAAIIRGLELSGEKRRDKWKIVVYDISKDIMNDIKQKFRVNVSSSLDELIDLCDVCILAVKPQDLFSVLYQISPRLSGDKLVISIAAGITTDIIRSAIKAKNECNNVPIIRAMPNTPALVGAGVTVFYPCKNVKAEDVDIACEIFSALGETIVLEKEELMDAVTALSGSSPAFIFLIAEALSDAGVKMGLPRKISNSLAAMSIFGAGALLRKAGKHPGELKDMVASPGGTTIAGIHILEDKGLRGIIMSAIEVSTLRSKEIGKEIIIKYEEEEQCL